MTTHADRGGAPKWTYAQMRLLQGSYDLYLGTGSEGWLTDASAKLCREIWVDKAAYHPLSLGYLWRLYRFVKKHRIDAVVASNAYAGVYARLLKLLKPSLRVAYVSHGWSALYRGSLLHRSAERLLARMSDAILAVSKSDAIKAVESLKIDPAKLTLIENGVMPCRKDEKIKKLEGLHLVMVARFEKPKRQDIVVKAAAEVPDATFHFLGDGPMRATLEQTAPSNVRFWGECEDVEQILQQMDLFVLLSDSEGMPLSILEALSCAKPLIVSDLPSLRGFVEENGIVVQNSVPALVAAIEKIKMGDLKEMSERSRKLFKRSYNLERKKGDYLDFYAGLIGSV